MDSAAPRELPRIASAIFRVVLCLLVESETASKSISALPDSYASCRASDTETIEVDR
jgi:hypothetical protein